MNAPTDPVPESGRPGREGPERPLPCAGTVQLGALPLLPACKFSGVKVWLLLRPFIEASGCRVSWVSLTYLDMYRLSKLWFLSARI